MLKPAKRGGVLANINNPYHAPPTVQPIVSPFLVPSVFDISSNGCGELDYCYTNKMMIFHIQTFLIARLSQSTYFLLQLSVQER